MKNNIELILKVIGSGKACQIGCQSWNVSYFQREKQNQTKHNGSLAPAVFTHAHFHYTSEIILSVMHFWLLIT